MTVHRSPQTTFEPIEEKGHTTLVKFSLIVPKRKEGGGRKGRTRKVVQFRSYTE